MAIIRNVEFWYPRLVRPNAMFDPQKPRWEVQIRTSDMNQYKELMALGLNLKFKQEDDGSQYWFTTLGKRSTKQDGSAATPIEVVDGKKEPINPDTIGNGSIGNIRLFESSYERLGKPAKRFSLMGVQITKLKLYKSKGPREEFDEEDMEIQPAEDYDAETDRY